MSDHALLMLCAAHCFVLAAFHAAFWKLFGWPQALAGGSIGNRVVPQILNLRLIYVFLGIGALCIAFPQELVSTALGRALMLGMAGFWLGRLIEQFVFLRYRRVAIHVLSAMFALGVVLFAWPVLR
jgi:hypothetical protein